MKDLFGQAILDYQQGQYTEDIKTETTISEEDVLPLPYLFRSFEQMPALEQKALQMAKGKVLEVGCGAGSHGLYLQNERKLEVHSIDLSPKAIEACQLRTTQKNGCFLCSPQNAFSATRTNPHRLF